MFSYFVVLLIFISLIVSTRIAFATQYDVSATEHLAVTSVWYTKNGYDDSVFRSWEIFVFPVNSPTIYTKTT
jgi:hypothetical protein